MASSAPRRSSFERSLRGEAVAGDAGLVNVAVNVLAFAPLAWGLALAVRFGVAPGPVGGQRRLIALPGRPQVVRAPGAGRCVGRPLEVRRDVAPVGSVLVVERSCTLA